MIILDNGPETYTVTWCKAGSISSELRDLITEYNVLFEFCGHHTRDKFGITDSTIELRFRSEEDEVIFTIKYGNLFNGWEKI